MNGDFQIDNLSATGPEMLRGRLISEGYPCLGIDIQATRFAPPGKGIRIEFSPDQHPTVTFSVFNELFDLTHPIIVGCRHIEGILKNSQSPEVIRLCSVPDNSPDLFHDADTLRKEVKKKLVDLDLDSRNKGAMSHLADELSARTGRKVSRTTLSMALSGYRGTEAYQAILLECSDMLAERLKRTV